MKRALLITGLVLFSFIGFGQNFISYEMVSKSPIKPKGKWYIYVSKAGEEYKIGDTLTFGIGSGINGNFVFISSYDFMGTQYQVHATNANSPHIIKKIWIGGSKKTGFYVSLQLKGNAGFYMVQFENAAESGEIKTIGMNSIQALEELKRAKTKLDLEIISQEEYNAIKAALVKYIK